MDLTKLIRTRAPERDERRRPLHILFVTSEVAPYSKTGGLGDVSASLPLALAEQGHHVTILTPRYRHIDSAQLRLSQRLLPLKVPRAGRGEEELGIWEGALNGRVRLLFMDHPSFSERDGLYGYAGDDFADNAARFALFSRGAAELAARARMPYDVIHCQDWHAALVPVYARHAYAKELAQTACVVTIHNLAFQGSFPQEVFASLNLPKRPFLSEQGLLHDGKINFLKAGLLYADRVTTVSPTYVREICTAEGGFGLDGTLRSLDERLVGILNGVDYQVWSPQNDREIPVRYDLQSLNGKRRNKVVLQHRFGLPPRPTAPLLGFVGRLTEQKGLDILLPALHSLLKKTSEDRLGFQVVFLGEGQDVYQERLLGLAKEFPRQVGVHLGYNESVAHLVQAGADMLLVPSRFEPCGLSQIYALRYGTVPIVHATGGLADTVSDADREAGDGTGFVFEGFTQEGLERAIERATARFTKMRQWRPLMVQAMAQDFSWKGSALQYEELFRGARDGRDAPAAKPKKAAAAAQVAEVAPVVAEAAPVEVAPVAEVVEAAPKKTRRRGKKAAEVVEAPAPVEVAPGVQAAPETPEKPKKKPAPRAKKAAEAPAEAPASVEAPAPEATPTPKKAATRRTKKSADESR